MAGDADAPRLWEGMKATSREGESERQGGALAWHCIAFRSVWGGLGTGLEVGGLWRTGERY